MVLGDRWFDIIIERGNPLAVYKNVKISHERPHLTGEHRYGDAGQLIIFMAFLVVWVLDCFVFKFSTFLNDYVPLPIKIVIGVALMAIALYFARGGMKIIFGEVPEKPGVIRTGVMGIVRHPIYLSEILFYLSLLFFRTSLAAAGVWLIAIGFLYYISRYEEKLLLIRFGNEYKQYTKDVGMFFPRLRVKK
jgi:protein-S-isoprenylcysteine O-methyltransferase Ste14